MSPTVIESESRARRPIMIRLLILTRNNRTAAKPIPSQPTCTTSVASVPLWRQQQQQPLGQLMRSMFGQRHAAIRSPRYIYIYARGATTSLNWEQNHATLETYHCELKMTILLKFLRRIFADAVILTFHTQRFASTRKRTTLHRYNTVYFQHGRMVSLCQPVYCCRTSSMPYTAIR